MRPEVARHRIPLPLRREVRALHDLQAGELRIRAGADARHLPARAFEGREDGAGEGPGDPRRARAIGQESLAPAVLLLAPGIPEPLGEDLHALRPRSVAEDTARVQPHHAPW